MRERNEQLSATHRCSATNWMAPSSCFGFHSQVFFFFLNVTTCPNCLDSVAIGNQIAESELRKPHPLSGKLLGLRLVNPHSDPHQSLMPVTQQGHGTHTMPAGLHFHHPGPSSQRTDIGSKQATFLCKDSSLAQLYPCQVNKGREYFLLVLFSKNP